MSARCPCLALAVCLALVPSVAHGDMPPADAVGDPLPEHALARLGTERFRHGGRIHLVAFLPGGKRVLSSDGFQVRVWDRASGKEVHHREAYARDYFSTALSPDGRLLACKHGVNDVRLYDTATGKERRRLPGGPDHFAHLTFSPDGRRLAMSGDRIRLWDVTTGALLRAFPKSKKGHSEMVFSPDGKTLISSGYDGKLRWWDVTTGRLLREVEGSKGAIPILVRSPDGCRLAFTDYDGEVGVWDARTGKSLLAVSLGKDQNGYFALAFSPDGKHLAAGGGDRSIRLWDLATGEQLVGLPGHPARVSALAFAADSKTLLSGGGDGVVRQWNLASRRELASFPGHQSEVSLLAVAPHGQTLATVEADASIHLWDLARVQESRTIRNRVQKLDWLVFSPDGRSLTAVSRSDRAVGVLNVAAGRPRRRFSTKSYPVALSADGRRLAVADGDRLEIWDLVDGKKVRDEAGEDLGRELGTTTFSPDGKTLFSIHDPFRRPIMLRRWDLATGKKVFRRVGVSPYAPNKLASSRGPGVVAAMHDGSRVFLWKWPSGESLPTILWGDDQRLPWGYDSWRALAISPDGRSVATASFTGIVRVWETTTGRERAIFRGHRGAVQAVTFSPDGRRLYSGGRDTTVLVWDLTGRARRPRAGPSAREADGYWRDLAGADAARAYTAVWALTLAPEVSVPLLRARLGVRTVPAARLARLVADLDSDDFPTRDSATRELRELGEYAEPALRRALGGKPPLERRRRVEGLLEDLAQARRNPRGDRLRALRGLEVLEAVGTPDAWRVVEGLARGFPAAQLTQEARELLGRRPRKLHGRP